MLNGPSFFPPERRNYWKKKKRFELSNDISPLDSMQAAYRWPPAAGHIL
jgi:hypothetical protein